MALERSSVYAVAHPGVQFGDQKAPRAALAAADRMGWNLTLAGKLLEGLGVDTEVVGADITFHPGFKSLEQVGTALEKAVEVCSAGLLTGGG